MTTVVAIDPATEWLTAIVSTDVNGAADVHRHRLGSEEEREGQAYVWLHNLLVPLIEPRVFLEQPIVYRGNTSTLALAQVNGALRAACQVSHVPIRMVQNQSWKSRVCGLPVGAQKPEIAAWVKGNWPELYDTAMEFGKKKRNGDQEPNFDICDAACIAIYGWLWTQNSRKMRRASAIRKAQTATRKRNRNSG